MRTGGLPELQWGRAAAAAAAAAAAEPTVGAGAAAAAIEAELRPPEPAGPSSGHPGEPDR